MHTIKAFSKFSKLIQEIRQHYQLQKPLDLYKYINSTTEEDSVEYLSKFLDNLPESFFELYSYYMISIENAEPIRYSIYIYI